jgi:hypothetical protein
LQEFLQALISDEEISRVNYLNSVQLGRSKDDNAVFDIHCRTDFDIHCRTETGERIIVEMQKVWQKYLINHSIKEQTKTNEWDFELKISILNFKFDKRKKESVGSTEQVHIEEINEYACYMELSDIHRKNRQMYIYLELPQFNKNESELKSAFDKWMYVLKNLAELQNRPPTLQERIFRKLFRIAEIEHLSPEERIEYRRSLMQCRDMNNVINSAIEKNEERMRRKLKAKEKIIKAKEEEIKAKEEEIKAKEKDDAIKEKDFHLVKNLSNTGLSPEKISEITGIDINRIHEIIENI